MADELEHDADDSASAAVCDARPEADLYELFLEQQRRLACPGCGEEAFLG